MKKTTRNFMQTYFGAQLEFRVRLFNVLAIAGFFVCFCLAVFAVVSDEGVVSVLENLAPGLLALGLLYYATKTGKYQRAYLVTIIVIFFGLFSFFYFDGGAYESAMPLYLICAVQMTIFMLEGKTALIVAFLELALYVSLIIVSYFHPELVDWLPDKKAVVTDFATGLVIVNVAVGACLFLHFRLYNAQQRKLDEQNEILAQVSRAKSEFLSNASHEMRTPLTVVSVNVQTVSDILDELAVKDEEAGELLKNAQGEIMRLGRMVGGMLTLASMSEIADRHRTDLSSLLESGAEMLRLNLVKRGNAIETDIEPGLAVFGNADLLAQVLANLLQNANAHMENGIAAVSARRDGTAITIAVRDAGAGISQELLPRVFERGVTTGGTGFGLYLCKTVIESHGGRIWIESEPGQGTTVFYTLPVYEGQLGGGG